MAMDQKDQEAVEKSDSCPDGRELFRIAKQRKAEKKDVVGVSCLNDESGVVKVSVDDRKKIWKENVEKFMNVFRSETQNKLRNGFLLLETKIEDQF